MDNLTETKLTSEKIYSGCILDFYRDTVRLPNGGTAPRELSRHVGAVCIVPLLDDDEFLNLQAVPLVLFGYVQCRWNRPFFSYGAQT